MWRRLLRIRFGSALLLSAPGLFLCGWYIYNTTMAHYSYVAAAGLDEPLTVEGFHVHLHDLLSRDVRRLGMPPPGKDAELPTLQLMLGNGELGQLAGNLPPGDGKGRYVPGYLQSGNEIYDVRVRYRGSRHWHWNYAQKSMKVRLLPGSFFEGLQTFNFINTPDPLPFAEQLVLDVARREGLLTPDYFPFRLMLNNAYMGIYFFAAQPGGGLLRNAQRMPGSIFSGNGAPTDPATGVSSLWASARFWKKVATTIGGKRKDMTELQVLLDAVNGYSQQHFASFARDHIDLDKFALLDALDVVFGCNQRDFDQNHKLYFDPYKGRFEPLAWNFRGWRHRLVFNRTENPLLLRLKQVPGYLSLRNRKVYELLNGPCSPAALRDRGEALIEHLSPAQSTDPHWDAYHLLPGVSRYYRQMVRPMDRQHQAAIFDSRMLDFARRAEFLLGEMSSSALSARLLPVKKDGDGGEGPSAVLEFTVGGVTGYRIEDVSLSWPAGCEPGDQQLGPETVGVPLYPGVDLVPREIVHERRGRVRTAAGQVVYRLGITSGCVPTGAAVVASNLVTGERLELNAVLDRNAAALPGGQALFLQCNDGVPVIRPGQAAMHPWCFHREEEGTVRLGPGVVEVDETRIFGAGETVVIAPGTEFRMAKKASFIFRGRLIAEGSADRPIRFVPKKSKWGGVALQGAGTAGSRLAHVDFVSGRFPKFGLNSFPGMLNIHDTRDIHLEHLRLSGNRKSDDALHIAYVHGLKLSDSRFLNVASDALDLEFSTGVIDGLTVAGAGDECIDLMGSKVEVKNAALADWEGSAISAGEETRLTLRDALLISGNVGVLAKNGSKVRLEGVLLSGNNTGVKVEYESDRYRGKSKVRGTGVHVVGCGVDTEGDERGFKGLAPVGVTP